MLRPLSAEFGWNVEQISSVFAVRFVLFGLLGPFAAAFILRFGLRRVMVTASGLIALAMILATRVSELWQLFVLWGLVLGCGTGLTALVLGAIVAKRWFSARRSGVLGVLAASTATGQLLFLPVAAWLIEYHGWRLAVVSVFIACFIVAAMVMLLLRDSPRELGLDAYGDAPGSGIASYGLSLFALFYGLDWIATVPPTVKLVGQTFERERAGIVFGWVVAAHQLGAATAAYGAGLTRTLLLTYTPALFAAGAACLLAAVAVLAIPRPRQVSPRP